jgi:hypothetical protein
MKIQIRKQSKGAGSYQDQSKTGNKKDMRLFKVGILIDITTRETFRLTTIYWVSFHNALVPDIGKISVNGADT